jgi:hypothetical protein
MPGASVERLRSWAAALPSVTETTHPRTRLPVWQVSGKTFLEIGPDRTTAIFRIAESSAASAVVKHPEYNRVVRRPDGRPRYLGLEVRLRFASGARLMLLVQEAWAATAPRGSRRSQLFGRRNP